MSPIGNHILFDPPNDLAVAGGTDHKPIGLIPRSPLIDIVHRKGLDPVLNLYFRIAKGGV
jgi:hypothetical protein